MPQVDMQQRKLWIDLEYLVPRLACNLTQLTPAATTRGTRGALALQALVASVMAGELTLSDVLNLTHIPDWFSSSDLSASNYDVDFCRYIYIYIYIYYIDRYIDT